MKINLTQNQRVIVAFAYLAILFGLFNILGGDFNKLIREPGYDSNIWFYSGAFMIILGSYIVEPYFTKPSDTIANSTAVLITLLGISKKENLFGYNFILSFAILILILGILTIFLKDSKTKCGQKFSKSLYWIVENFGASKFIFSIIYLFAAYSYFGKSEKIIPFICIITFWVCLTFFDVIGIIVEKISKLIKYLRNNFSEELGQAIGCENPLLYKVEINYTKYNLNPVKYGELVALETSNKVGSIGMVVDTKYLLNKMWLSIYLLQDENGDILKINLKEKKLITDPKTVFTKNNLVYLLDIDSIPNESLLKTMIEENPLYRDREQFVGYVSSGSNINLINFLIIRNINNKEQKISEGVILKTIIYEQETLYQIINGNAKEEYLENFDRHSFIIGIARKLGKYNKETKELDVIKWMPSIFSPLFFAFSSSVSDNKIKEFAKKSIGHLPETDLEIPIKDLNAIVTHNTAILGILGIGKSCLAYELIKRISDESIKVICIDITNEYIKELPSYLSQENSIVSDNENVFDTIKKNYEYIHKDEHNKQIPEKSGNLAEYKKEVRKDLCQFLFNRDNVPETITFEKSKRVKIYNIDYHKASHGEKIGYNVIATDLTQAEKTRIIAEVILKILMEIPLSEEKKAKVLLVFEEAHALIPEWNTVANEGDKNATNGTAKVILQGRKYGLGSLIITQRTANVSKSILNQCNTIFALRVFDKTAQEFLENYIGGDYANTLATLEERHAVVFGKGLNLKQPVIVQLNDRKNVISQTDKNSTTPDNTSETTDTITPTPLHL